MLYQVLAFGWQTTLWWVYSGSRNLFLGHNAMLASDSSLLVHTLERGQSCVCLLITWDLQKTVNWPRCCLGDDSCRPKEACFTWGSRSNESICHDGVRPFVKILWPLVKFGAPVLYLEWVKLAISNLVCWLILGRTSACMLDWLASKGCVRGHVTFQILGNNWQYLGNCAR